jgi:hypothetical protein
VRRACMSDPAQNSLTPSLTGTYADSSTLTCITCAPGFISAASATQCTQCQPNQYAFNNTCVSCPFGSRSSAGSSELVQCLCDYSFYPSPNPEEGATTFSCVECPEGGLCDSTHSLAPLALAGYWRPNETVEEVVFYECEGERCEEETPETVYNNCREGHVGPLCSLCDDGWALAGELCIPCTPNQAYTNWPRARLSGFLFAVFFLVFVLSLGVLLQPLFATYGGALVPGPLRRYALGGGKGRMLTPEDTAAMRYGMRMVAFTAIPMRLVVEVRHACAKQECHVSHPGSHRTCRLCLRSRSRCPSPGQAPSTL